MCDYLVYISYNNCHFSVSTYSTSMFSCLDPSSHNATLDSTFILATDDFEVTCKISDYYIIFNQLRSYCLQLASEIAVG